MSKSIDFNPYLVVSTNDWDKLSRARVGTTQKYSEDGNVFRPIGSLAPVIVRGKGCKALAKIESVMFDSTGTTTTIVLKNVTASDAEAFYNAYRAFNSAIKSDDEYESAKDMKLPGSFISKGVNPFSDDDDDDDSSYDTLRRRHR